MMPTYYCKCLKSAMANGVSKQIAISHNNNKV